MRANPALVISVIILSYAFGIDPRGIESRGIGVATAIAAELATPRPWQAEQNQAVLQARQGEALAALPTLERIERDHPRDIGVSRDVIVVNAWAGRDAEAIRLFGALKPGPQPDYVIAAVALSYRHLGKPAEALVLYQQGLLQSPANAAFTAGEIRSLVELAQAAQASTLADADLQAHGERPDVLLAAGFAARAQKYPVEALRYIDRALKVDPSSHEAKHDRLMAIDEMGAPQVARQLADANPGVLTQAELRQIDGDAAAALVRADALEPPSEALRFAATDRAIAALDALIARWTQNGETAQDILRARFDRMVAYRDRVRMADVIAEYDALSRQGIAIPDYARLAAGDAYLYLRQPEAARDIFLHSLETSPRDADTRLALFYAYVDLDDFAAAYPTVDRAVADQAIWICLKGLNDPIENPDRASADLAAGDARLYGGQLADAQQRIAAIADKAPNKTDYLSALADVYSARGWPRLAAEEYDISRALKPLSVATEVGQALNNLERRDYRDAEAEAADLTRRFPENLAVQRLDRLWQVHNMAEFDLKVEQTLTSSTNVAGGSGIAVDSQLYSPPIDYNWRIFGGAYVAHEVLPQGEGAVTLRQSGVGAEYSDPNLVASLEGTVNAYGPKIGGTLGSSIDSGRAGARALATWSINDYWEVGGDAERFARDTPLRALGSGITANAASTDVVYRESESREARLGGEAMIFSDRNVRTSLNGQFTQRLVTQPHFTFDAIVGLAELQNSANANRPYYNPSRDGIRDRWRIARAGALSPLRIRLRSSSGGDARRLLGARLRRRRRRQHPLRTTHPDQ